MRLSRIFTPVTIVICFIAGTAMFPKPSVQPTVTEAQSAPAGMPQEVARVFNRACKDCHSNNTTWPWYSKVPPLSLAIQGDVHRGRAFMNLSEWETYSKGRKLGFLSALQVAVAKREMPPRTYRWLHGESVLSAPERQLLASWALRERARLRLLAAR